MILQVIDFARKLIPARRDIGMGLHPSVDYRHQTFLL
jgi:hypothetical protein